jgi:DDE superfamily endonuclease
MNGAGGGDGEAARDALRDFRRAVYRGLRGWADALFELSHAMLDATAPVGSVPSLSLEPVFRRSHGSLYKALDHGRIDAGRVRAALAAARPADWPAVFAVDASTWPRCDAETSPQRGFYYHPSRHSAGQPIVAGWSYQWIAGLSWAPDSCWAQEALGSARLSTNGARKWVRRAGRHRYHGDAHIVLT